MLDNREVKLERLQMFDGTQLNSATYNLVIGLTLMWGIVLNILMATFLSRSILAIPYIGVIILYFIGSILGTMVVYKSGNPGVSFAGFTVLAISMGLLLTYYVQYFRLGSVLKAFYMTGIVVAIMLVASTVLHSFFLGLGRILFFALLATIVAEVIFMLLGYRGSMFDWIVVLIFSGYLGYDWAKAQEYPPTLDNAVDSAADIYVDIVNLFVRILSIMGRRKD